MTSVGERRAAADCRWAYGLVLLALGDSRQSWELLRAAVDYGQATGLASAAKQLAAIAGLEAGTLRPEDAVWDVDF